MEVCHYVTQSYMVEVQWGRDLWHSSEVANKGTSHHLPSIYTVSVNSYTQLWPESPVLSLPVLCIFTMD